MRVSGVFSDAAMNKPRELSDLIRNRVNSKEWNYVQFKASEKLLGFKSIDNTGEESVDLNGDAEEIVKCRLSVIYKYILCLL